MDYKNLNADVNLILNTHYTVGRQGNNVQYVVLHWNAGDLTCEQCYNVWTSREASAHYQVESNGRIGQFVWDDNTAWHAGNWNANLKSVGVEHANQGDYVTPECINAGAKLVASLCKHFNLGRPTWGVNVFGHSDFSTTACPGILYNNAEYMAIAQAFYDNDLNDVTPTPSEPLQEIERVDNGVYRFYDERTNSHMFTTSYDEAISCRDNGWHYEGIGWYSDNEGAPVYRMYNDALDDHLFTCNADEALGTTLNDWAYEGIAFTSGQGQGVHRLYRPEFNKHFYTASDDEFNICLENGWSDEGIAFNAMA